MKEKAGVLLIMKENKVIRAMASDNCYVLGLEEAIKGNHGDRVIFTGLGKDLYFNHLYETYLNIYF